MDSRTSIDTALAAATARGWLHRAGERVAPTDEGLRVHNDLLQLFL